MIDTIPESTEESSPIKQKRKRWWIIILTIAILLVGLFTYASHTFELTRTQPAIASHPLDPLTANEIETTVALIKQAHELDETVMFPALALLEPDKAEVLHFQPGKPFNRKAQAIIYERSSNKTYEAIVDLNTKIVSSWQEIKGLQSTMADPDWELAAKTMKADPKWQEAMRKRGFNDFGKLAINCWAPSILTEKEKASGLRLCRGLTYYKGDKDTTNYYTRPIEGVLANVDLTNGKVIEILDRGDNVPFSDENWDYDQQSLQPLQSPLKPLKTRLPKGSNIQINGHEIAWRGWKFRYAVHPRDGLILYQVSYKDGEELRPILYRASLSEMFVPYGDPDSRWTFRNAFDVGEYNFGAFSAPLEVNKDVPENAVLLDAVLADPSGKPRIAPRVVGIYEQNNGRLWKHFDREMNQNYSHLNRELVLTTTGTILNYDYAINWVFHQDGTLELQDDLTGVVMTKATAAETAAALSEQDTYGRLMARNILGVNHQHFFNFRLDMDVDGTQNAVMEMNSHGFPVSSTNPLGNAFVAEDTMLPTEKSAMRDLNMASAREWTIVSKEKKNGLGVSSGYTLMPMTNAISLLGDDAQITSRSGFATHHFWVTKYKPDELYAGGMYPNQNMADDGLPQYISDDESVDGEDLVVWYTMGITHIPRPEDWPVMPVHRIGFKLMPNNFFKQNPTINLPEPSNR